MAATDMVYWDMQLHSEAAPSDLTLRFASPEESRAVRDLKPGEVRLLCRGEQQDEAVALAPTDVAQARQTGTELARLARELAARSVSVESCAYPAALAGAAVAAGWSDERYKGAENGGLSATPRLHVAGLSPAERRRTEGVLGGVTLARELTGAPANVLNPATLAREARKLAQDALAVEVWDESDIRARGMNLLLAVAAGSELGPRLIRLVLPARSTARRVVALVGKGITFDTGGYSIKTSQGMYGMKNDMGGAAAVLGSMRALSELRDLLPEDVEVRAYIAAAENMIGPRAMRPGDIYRSASGKTVEVTNTDAEGRLVLADALSVACQEGATEVIDIATLTGVKVSALGSDIAALFCNDRSLAGRLQRAAEQAGELLWELPLHAPYLQSYRQKTLADLKNSDMNPAGASIKAALFLQEFVTRPWAHLDIAGNAEHEGAATGWGVATLTEFALASGGDSFGK